MEFLLNGGGYSIPDAIPTNDRLPASTSASLFGSHCGQNSQLQKTKNLPDSERRSPEDTEAFTISRNSGQSDQRPPVPAFTITDLSYREATAVTMAELRRPSSSLSVSGTRTAQVGKKRSRASRRMRTTLLKTDTANFRAMVQRFTGIPETPFRFASMNRTFFVHVGQQESLVLDPHMNWVSNLNSVPNNYDLQQYNSTALHPFRFLHDNINISNGLNLFRKAPQGQYSSNPTPPNDVGLMNSASVFPTPSITLASDIRSAYLM